KIMFQDLTSSELQHARYSIDRFMLCYKFATDEVLTKIKILQEEFSMLYSYNPIEHINSRVKTLESLMKKLKKRNIPFHLDNIRSEIMDIAGIRITCSFVSNVYELSIMLQNQQDIKVLDYKDYISHPKPNGYRSLHLILEIPVFLSDRVEKIPVEVQIRTVAMDFWASLEHKIYYKYMQEIPDNMLRELKEAATISALLDEKMEDLNKKVTRIKKFESNLSDSNQETEPLYFYENFIKESKRVIQMNG
ncbi:MAG: RelA/SpoT protein, partial [Bacillales bacterium]|nr:RelA/SpoT protein [Bacillales bacterium]